MNAFFPTPAILIDLAVVKRNLKRMEEYAKAHHLDLRPHIKTHKSIFFGEIQFNFDTSGLTVAKVSEAAVMSNVCDEILIAYPLVDSFQIQQAAKIKQLTHTFITADSSRPLEELNEASGKVSRTPVGVLVDVDVGYHRTGVQSPQEALKIAREVEKYPYLELIGLFCYYGHISQYQPHEQEPHLKKVSQILRDVLALWKEHGIEAKTVSGGSTPTAYQSHLIPELTEIRPGTYIFNDRNSISSGFCTIDDCAARVCATVVSTAVPGKVVVDAGSKTLSSDRLIHNPDEAGHGLVVDYPEAKITRLSEEHGEIDITQCASAPQLGERLYIIPNHICPCINLQNQVMILHEDGSIKAEPVDARGMVV